LPVPGYGYVEEEGSNREAAMTVVNDELDD
jgi:hypothetical protein